MALMSEVMERVSILFFHKSPPCSLPGVLSESSPRDLIERGVSGGAPLSRLPASSWITLRLDFLFMLSERSGPKHASDDKSIDPSRNDVMILPRARETRLVGKLQRWL